MFTIELQSEYFGRPSTTLPIGESVVRPSSTLTIGGVKIDMPVKPYPSQVAMMDKVPTFNSYYIDKSFFFSFRLFVAVKKDKIVF